ncbi:MAG: ABC transporter substrate-binding protein [Propionicimonas sp.]
MSTKARIAKSLAVVSAVALFAGCGGTPSPSGTAPGGTGEKTEITFLWLWGEAEDQVLRELVTEFNAAQDKINVTGVSSPDTVAQLTAMTSSTGSFDVSDFFGNSTAAWAEMGILEPLDDYIARDNFDTSDFIPETLAQNVYKGKTYALPLSAITQQLYYNKDLLAEAGYDRPPQTLEELAEYTQKLTKVDDQGAITQLGLAGPWAGVIINPLTIAHGGSFFGLDDGASGPQPDNPGAREALNFWNDNVLKPFGADKVLEFTAGFGAQFTPDYPLYNGKVAMFIDGAYHNAQIPIYAPDLNYGVAPIPHPAAKPELAGSVGIDNSTFFIPANSQNKDAAWEFMKFLYQKENLLRFNKSQTNLPPLKSALDDPIWDDLPEGFGVFLDSLRSPNLRYSPAQPWNAEFSNDLNVIFDDFTSGRAGVDETMQKAKTAAERFQS